MLTPTTAQPEKEMIEVVKVACTSEGYNNPCALQLKCRDSGKYKVIAINKPESTINTNDNEVHSSLYVNTNFQSQMMHIMK